MLENSEICCHCGRSVAPGKGLFIDRIPASLNPDSRFPLAEWICRDCDNQLTPCWNKKGICRKYRECKIIFEDAGKYYCSYKGKK